MNERMAEIIALYYPFTAMQILGIYQMCKSWDAVLIACENCQILGISTLTLEKAVK